MRPNFEGDQIKMGRQCGFQFYWLSTLLGRGGSSLFSASSLAEPAWLWESWCKKRKWSESSLPPLPRNPSRTTGWGPSWWRSCRWSSSCRSGPQQQRRWREGHQTRRQAKARPHSRGGSSHHLKISTVKERLFLCHRKMFYTEQNSQTNVYPNKRKHIDKIEA